MYNRFDFGIHPRECLTNLLTVTYNHTKSLEGHINYLKEKVQRLQQFKDKQHKLNLVDTDLVDAKQQLVTKQNSIESQSIKSFDSINSSLKIVEECMQRLQMKHNLSRGQGDELDGREENGDCRIDVNLIELINSIQSVALDWQSMRSVRKCVCGGSFEQTNYPTTNCWSCGLVYCQRCLEKRIKLPGLLFGDRSTNDELEQSSRHKQTTMNNELNNQKNEQMNNYVKLSEQVGKYKVHPLEQLDQPLDQKLNSKQLIEPIESIVEQTRKVNNNINFKHHPLEILEDSAADEDSFEPIEPIELGIECEEEMKSRNDTDRNGKCNVIQSANNRSDLVCNQTQSALYEFVPVCLSCYRQMVKVN